MSASTNRLRILLGSAALSLLLGCADQKARTIAYDSRPAADPTASTTVFRGALQCLDGLLARRRGPTTDIVVGQMPDSTGKFPLSMRDMTIHAITSANARSGAFRVIDQPHAIPQLIQVAQPPLDTLPSNVSPSSYNLSGSIISASPALYSESLSLGFGSDTSTSANGGFAWIAQLGTAATGMRLSRRGTNETLYSSQHEIVLQKSEFGFDARVGFAGYGASAGVSFDSRDSSAKAIQTLVELLVLELLGRAANVPYWECLSRPSSNSATAVAASERWDGDGDAGRRDTVAAGLKTLGYMGPLGQAIQKFQIDHGLTPTARMSYEVFLAVNEELASAKAVPETAGSNIAIRAANLQPGRGHWRLEIGLRRSAFVRCYYQADDGVIAQVYPNRFDRTRWLAANSTHFVPSTSTEQSFVIGGSAPRFLCFSSDADPEPTLPVGLRQPGFQDLRALSVTSFADLVALYGTALKGAVEHEIWPNL